MSTQRRLLYERDAAQRRANTERVIKRRQRIVNNVWYSPVYEDQPNRFSKWNLTCDCPQHKLMNDDERRAYQHRARVRMNVEFDDWAFDNDDHLCESIYNQVMYGDPEWEREVNLSD